MKESDKQQQFSPGLTCGRGEISTQSFGSHLNPISTREGKGGGGHE